MKTQEEIEQLANEYSYASAYSKEEHKAFKDGYTQCQENMADKKYTFNQITDAMAMAREINGKETYYKYSMEEIINSLNKQD